eukprot:scaffold25477_cov60-Phaeocystis_antarctica.AAC.3
MRCLDAAAARRPGLLGLTLLAPGRATHSAQATEPHSAQWEAAVRRGPLLRLHRYAGRALQHGLDALPAWHAQETLTLTQALTLTFNP